MEKKNKVEMKEELLQGILTNKSDVYNTRYVEADEVSRQLENFSEILKNTIEHFKAHQVKGFFLSLSLSKHAHLFKTVHDNSFQFHHAEGDIATLAAWLRTDRKNRLPKYSTHYVGVGGLVIDLEQELVLVIKEKSGHDVNGWKVPGGLVDVGEYLPEAVTREVLEETGVKTEFEGVLAFREKSPYHFGRNDLYFVCLLKPESSEIVKCEVELAKCRWMKLRDFVESDTKVMTQKRVAEIARKILDYKRAGKDIAEFVWKMNKVETNLRTMKAIHPMYYSKL